MNERLPPLGGLRAFEATARLGSATAAAAELHVTPGAVSLQVRELEAALGLPLFVRRPRKLTLTAEGAQYFASLRAAFRLMREATAELTARRRGAVLTLSCTPGFAVQWLLPRLARFEAAAPSVDLRIGATNRVLDFTRDGVDVAIRHGLGRDEGLVCKRLLDDALVPVCRPDVAARAGGLRAPSDLRAVPLLHDEHPDDWRLWLEAAGADGVDAARGAVFADGNGAIEAAKAGLGVALVRPSLVARELAEGALIAPFPQGIASALAYHLVYPPAARDRPALAAFRDWIIAEARGGAAP
jgi:LysR family transcriptional regulator, glycine cleavage system transcriptional activator